MKNVATTSGQSVILPERPRTADAVAVGLTDFKLKRFVAGNSDSQESLAKQRADAGKSGHVAAVPFHAELEVLMGVMTLRIDGELGHALPRETQLATVSAGAEIKTDCGDRELS
jgi:hypothetical protein